MTEDVRQCCTRLVVLALLCFGRPGYASGQESGVWQLRFPTEEETRTRGIPVIRSYMELMVKDWVEKVPTDTLRRALVSKEFLASQGVDPHVFRVNDYGFDAFEILGVKRNYVRVKGFNRANRWARVVSFRMPCGRRLHGHRAIPDLANTDITWHQQARDRLLDGLRQAHWGRGHVWRGERDRPRGVVLPDVPRLPSRRRSPLPTVGPLADGLPIGEVAGRYVQKGR